MRFLQFCLTPKWCILFSWVATLVKTKHPHTKPLCSLPKMLFCTNIAWILLLKKIFWSKYMFPWKAKAKRAAYIPPHSASSTLCVVYKLIMQATHWPPQQAGYSFCQPQKDRRLSQPLAGYLGLNPGSWAQFWLQYSHLTTAPRASSIHCTHTRHRRA